MKRREWLAATLAASLGACRKAAAAEEFQESAGPALNSERGFYVQRAAEQPGDLSMLRKEGISLVLLTLDLRKHRDRPLDEAKLERLDVALKAVREAGLKVIFRAAYGFTDADYRVDPADLGLIRGHIARMAGLLSRHAPVVWAVQAGMLGPWGEWHGSNHGNPPSLEARRAVVEAWLEGLPSTVFLQVRRPMFLRDLFPGTDNPGLARCGWHNDALLAMPDDMGTFADPSMDRANELEWGSLRALWTPFGGETVPASEGTNAAQVLGELEQLRISYLNRDYHPATLQRWRTLENAGRNLFAEVEARLGHRWMLKRLDRAVGSLELANTGFAPLYTTRKLELGWWDTAVKRIAGPVTATGSDLKNITGSREIPFKLSAAPAGAVLAMRIPDPAASLCEDGRYAIRLASAGLSFDEESGWNILSNG